MDKMVQGLGMQWLEVTHEMLWCGGRGQKDILRTQSNVHLEVVLLSWKYVLYLCRISYPLLYLLGSLLLA